MSVCTYIGGFDRARGTALLIMDTLDEHVDIVAIIQIKNCLCIWESTMIHIQVNTKYTSHIKTQTISMWTIHVALKCQVISETMRVHKY